ncbi:MAG: metallophosphoesterase, partial [Candidatus Eisenbacteria bacterium]
MSSLFSWLHLSDLHVGHGSFSHRLDQRLVLDQLRHDIEHRPADFPDPDVILVTGDVAFSADSRAPEEYDIARQWLHECAKLLGLGPEAVFIVPGNHDVDRRVAKNSAGVAALLESLRSGSRSVDEALAATKERKALRYRFAAFESFTAEFAPVARDEKRGLAWSYRYTGRDGLAVRLVGLNTALLSQDDRDSQALRLGKGQIVGTLLEPQRGHDELVIALAHHSFSWLADGVEAERRLRNYVHVFLSGHIHRADSRLVVRGGGDEAVTVTAGAVHGDENEAVVYGYSFGAVFGKPGAALELRVWPRAWSRENQDFRLDVENAPRDKSFARFQIRPGLLAPARPAVPTHATPTPTPPAPPPVSTMPRHLPPLVVYVVWHPVFVAGKAYAEGLFGLLARDVADPLSQGLGIPVFFRSVSTVPYGVPIEIDFKAAKRTAVVALLDDELLSHSDWRLYLTGLAKQAQASGRGHFFLPVALSKNALLLEKASNLHFIRLDLQPSEAQVEYLEASVLHALCRRLTQVSEPAAGAAPAPLKVFLSHAKEDGHEAAKEIQSRLQSPHGLESFYDT